MKSPLIAGLSFSLALAVNAQTNVSSTPIDGSGPIATNISQYEVAQRDANSQIWKSESYQQTAEGVTITNVHEYTEIASGLNHVVNGEWVQSTEQVEVLPTGGGAATNGQHQAYFPGDIYDGVIELVTPDGKHLKSRPLGISYYDGSNSVLIAELKHSIGQILPSGNQIIYTNAFTDFAADLLLTYRRGGFESDLVFREQPPVPEAFQLSSKSCRIELLTEFFDTPEPQQIPADSADVSGQGADAATAVQDNTLVFGATTMVQGRAFSVNYGGTGAGSDGNSQSVTQTKRDWLPVSKSWGNIQGRTFLIESVSFEKLSSQLRLLPMASMQALQTSTRSVLHQVSTSRLLPPARIAKRGAANIQLAKADFNHGPSVVLDYVTVSAAVTNFTFQGDTTYLITGPVSLYGNTVIEGGAVVKFVPTNGCPLNIYSNVTCQTAPYRPAIFTSRDDNSVGEAVSGSTGVPVVDGQTYDIFIQNGLSTELHDLRVSYAYVGITMFPAPGITLRDIQFVHTAWPVGIFATSVNSMYSRLRNILMVDVTGAAIEDIDISADVENLTVNGCAQLGYNDSNAHLNMTNCLLVGVQQMGDIPYTTNCVAIPSTNEVVFQTSGAGNCYLVNTSAYRNAGTTNIDSTLLAELATKTTYPSMTLSNQVVNADTNLAPVVWRDTDTPDLGYHYDPIDYLVDNWWFTNAEVTISSGTTIACYNDAGIIITDGSTINSIGTPTAPVWFTRYSAVQEESVNLPNTNSSPANAYSVYSFHATNAPSGFFQFTKFSCPGSGGTHLYTLSENYYYSNLMVLDCEFWNGDSTLSGWYSTTTCLKNDLFARATMTAVAGGFTGNSLLASNNLFWNTTTTIRCGQNSNSWFFFNNVFDNTVIKTNSFQQTVNGYNAYIGAANRLFPTNTHDIVSASAFGYQSGPLGGFYQPTNSILTNLGSCTADLAGLYHYTTQTNQVKETNSIVDIGYHYVALTNGNPFDTDGDGVPDYLADPNGNGLVDAGESDWAVATNAFPYGAPGYLYRVVTYGDISGFYLEGFDDSSFTNGMAAFGFSDGECPDLTDKIKTGWSTSTDVLLRRNFIVPFGVTNLSLGLAIDDNAQIFINGVQITPSNVLQIVTNEMAYDGSWFVHSGCATYDSLVVKGISPSIWRTGTNLLAVRGRDLGDSSFADARIAYLPARSTHVLASILSPTNSQFFVLSPTNIVLTGWASSSDAYISTVGFYSGSTWLGNATNTGNGAYALLWTNVTAGIYSLTMRVTNSLGEWGGSFPVSVTINAMPTVSIVTPTNLQTFPEVTNVLLTAVASDAESGTNVSVVFYYTNAPIGTGVYVGGFSNVFVWNGRTANSRPTNYYPIVAVATDTNGASSASDYVVFSIVATNPLPHVEITFPTNDTTLPPGSDLTIMARVTTTNPAPVTNVEFFVNGVSIGSDTNPPYSVTKCCLKPGIYVVVAKAVDSNGLWSISQSITNIILDDQPTSTGQWDAEFGQQAIKLASPPNSFLTSPGNISSQSGMLAVESQFHILISTNETNWIDLGSPFRTNEFGALELTFVDGTNIYAVGGGPPEPGENQDPYVIYRWDSTISHWTPVGNGLTNGTVKAVARIDGDLYVGGSFRGAGTNAIDTNVQYVARLDAANNNWVSVGNGLSNTVYAIASVGNELYVGGAFTNAGRNPNANYIARLIGNVWTNLGAGLALGNGYYERDGHYGIFGQVPVKTMVGCADDLYVGGQFVSAGSDTNAHGIAIWNSDTGWRTLNGGPGQEWINEAGFFTNELYDVYTISPHGNTVFIGGEFTNVYDGSAGLLANFVAVAKWREDEQRWQWSDLDQGVDPGAISPPLSAVIINSEEPDKYNFYILGNFVNVGSAKVPSGVFGAGGLARWRVGYSQSTNVPVVTIRSPISPAIFTNFATPTNITFIAEAESSYTNFVATAMQFYANGVNLPLITGDFVTNNALWSTNEWDGPAPGLYLITAVAADKNGLVGSSVATIVNVKSISNSITAVDDQFMIPEGTTAAIFTVLTNDIPSAFLRITNVTTLPSKMGSVKISPDGKYLTYSPLQNVFGTDQFFYTVTDGTNSDSASVTVKILSPPVVKIAQPKDGQRLSTSAPPITVTATTTDYDGSVTNVTIYTNGLAYKSFTNNVNGAFTTNWTANMPGFYTFVAVAIDNDGLYGTSAPVTIVLTNGPSALPVAAISNFVANAVNNQGIVIGDVPLINTGLTNLIGCASDPDGDPVSYAVQLFRPEDWELISDNLSDIVQQIDPFADLTPGPLNPQGFHTNGAVGNLGTLDFTHIPDGIYDLVLRVRGGTDESDAIVRVRLENQLKIGQFSFSEQDLVLPVNGIPLTVTRTYNSLNPDSGPFGTSWTFALNDMNVQLDETRTDVTIGTDDAPFDDDDTDTLVGSLQKVVSVRTGGSWDVTLTLPDGRRVTFPFQPVQEANEFQAVWGSPPGIKATLTVDPDSYEIPYYPYLHWQDSRPLEGTAPFENHDIKGWTLQMPDGTKYKITRGTPQNVLFDPDGSGIDVTALVYGPPKLTEIDDLSGNKTIIQTNGIFSYDTTTNLTRWTLFEHDDQGRITAIHDPNGGSNGIPVVKYVYNNDTGNLIQVLKLVDRTAGTYTTNKYHYDNLKFPHYITSIENGDGIPVTVNHYDSSGRLTNSADGNGNSITFVHNTSAQVEMVVDAMGNTNTYAYDLNGNVTNTVDPLGRQTTKTFDGNGNVTSITDPLTNTYHFTYDANGKQTSVINPLGHTNYIAYNSFGLLTAITNVFGLAIQFEYDSLGNLTNRIDALSHQFGIRYDQNSRPIIQTDALNRTNVIVSYDSAGNLATLSNLLSGRLTTYSYDFNGIRTGSSNVWVNPTNSSDVRAITNGSVFDAQGREISSTDPDGNNIRFAYNAGGQQTQTSDQYNRVCGWTYDASGNMVQITHSDGTVSQMVYDNNNRLSVSDDTHSPGTVVNGTRISYDAAGQVIKSERLTNVVISVSTFNGVSSSTLDSIGGVIATCTYGYDPAGRQIAVTNGFGGVTQFQYDSVGNQTATIDTLSNRTDYVYDAAGKLIFMTNALKGVTQYVYDELDRPIRTIFPDGSSTGLGYGICGELLADTNELGLVTAYYYDSAEQITNIVKPSVFDPEGATNTNPKWGFVYDNYGQVASISNPKHRVTRFTYDQLGRPQTRMLPMGQTASQEYDSFGRIFRKVDFNGQTNEFIYNASGQLSTNRFYAVGSSTPNVLASYVYDGQDRISQIIEPRGTNVIAYDGQGHVLRIDSPEGIVSYEYEPVEGLRTRVYTTNTDLRYSYDELGRIKTVSVTKRDGVVLSPFEVTTNTYTALGNLQNVYYPNGVAALYQYDLMNRLTNLVYSSGSGQLLAQYLYAPNTNGQWKTATEIQWQSGPNFSTNQFAWFYDNLGRLLKETCGSTTLGLSFTNQYVFDLLGNRLWETNVLGSITTITGYTYNTNDQLLVESGGTSFTNLYDANGSLTNRVSETETNGYVFNLQNRLSSASIQRIDSGHTVSEKIGYTYDYQGNRVRTTWSRSVDGSAPSNGTNIFLIEPNAASGPHQVLEESPALGATPIVTYTLGAGVVSQQRSNVITHFLTDGHGSTRLLADTNAGVVARFTYDAYGKPLNFTADLYTVPATKLLYSGGQYDTDLQQYNAQARYYSPVTGRFGQADPFSGKQQTGANLYAYCEDDPVNSIDPTGQYEIDVHQFLTQYLADKAGFDKATAARIGVEAQGPDALVTQTKQPDGTFLDQSRSAFDGKSVNQDNMKFYHFVDQERLALMATHIGNGRWRRIGEFFHAQEDTYAHSSHPGGRNFEYYGDWGALENGGFAGHGLYGHNPDQTWRDVPKAMKMARRVFADMQGILADPQHKYPGSFVCTDEVDESIPNPKWDAIKGDVQKFVAFPPNVIMEHSGFDEQVTFGGYNTKIQLLDSSYQVNLAYKNPPGPFPSDIGYHPGNFFVTKVRSLGSAANTFIDVVGGPLSNF